MYRYVTANASMCQGWREGVGRDADASLHHRPQPFVKHMSDMFSKALNIPAGNIVTVESNNSFKVCSRGGTYEVCWGDENTRQIPTCQCMAFKRSHMPCKHMCVIIHYKRKSFDSLPAFYRNHVLITVDADCLQMEVAASENFSASDEGHAINNSNGTDSDETIPPVANIESCARQMRNLLQKMLNLSYIAVAQETIQTSYSKLEEAYKLLVESCPLSGNLLLEGRTAKGSSSLRRKGNITYAVKV